MVYPGLEAGAYAVGEEAREDFYLIVSALVPYKRVDLAVEAFCGMEPPYRKRLVIIGKGPEERRLKKMARETGHIEFLGHQSDEVILRHYQKCAGFLFPGTEDFGLTVVEAQACGAGVIAYGAGGARETVVEGVTGVFFEEQTAAGLRGAIERFEGMRFEAAACRENAMRFTWAGFREGMYKVVAEMTSKQPPP